MALTPRKKNWAYKLIRIDADKANPTDLSTVAYEMFGEVLIPSNRSVESKAKFLIAAQIAANGEPATLFHVKDETSNEWFKVKVKLHKESGRYNFTIERPVKFVGGGSAEASDETREKCREEMRNLGDVKASGKYPKSPPPPEFIP